MDRTAEVLFEYLKDILYHPPKAELDLEALPADYKKLGMGLQQLEAWVRETNEFSKALANGDLMKEPPKVDNVLAAPIKALQGSLRHLVWQTEQVAKGDFSQKVDFMGEFSEAFNTMIQQLSERTEGLIKEKSLVESMNLELQKNLELMQALINYTHNMIFVISTDRKECVFQNQPAEWFRKVDPTAAAKLWKRLVIQQIEEENRSKNWEIDILCDEDSNHIYYGIESFHITWSGIPAIVHIVIDDTKRKTRENLIYNMAYLDPLTGLKNRLYARERMEDLIKGKKPFLLSLVDVDYLKYCNDNFGHDSGDEYLRNVSNILNTMRCEVCRVGGDEFYLLEEGTDKEGLDRQLSHLREFLLAQTDCPYPQSFSYATSAIPKSAPRPLEQYLRDTDTNMYDFRRKNRKPLRDLNYKDDRI